MSANRADYMGQTLTPAAQDDPENDPPAREPSEWSPPADYDCDGSVEAMARRAAEAKEEPGTWAQYVAGVVVAYLGGGVDDERIKPIAGIIERRLWALRPATPQPQAAQPVEDLIPEATAAKRHAAKCRSFAGRLYNETPSVSLSVEAGNRLQYAAQLLDILAGGINAMKAAEIASRTAAPALTEEQERDSFLGMRVVLRDNLPEGEVHIVEPSGKVHRLVIDAALRSTKGGE